MLFYYKRLRDLPHELKTPLFPNVFSACYSSRQRNVVILTHKILISQYSQL